MTTTQRKNLLKLANYLESLPEDYKHFDMMLYADHRGECDLPGPTDVLAAKEPNVFLSNCGTVACAIGHGPAAGVPLLDSEFRKRQVGPVHWYRYAVRAFGSSSIMQNDDDEDVEIWEFLFDSDWRHVDNHHYGAAARIRYLLDGRPIGCADRGITKLYAPYRKGSRSAKRREIDAVAA